MSILFVTHMPPSTSELRPLVDFYLNKKNIKPIIYFNHSEEYVDKSFFLNCKCYFKKKLRCEFKNVKLKNFVNYVLGFINHYLHFPIELLNSYATYKHILNTESIETVFLGADMAHLDSSMLIKMAKKRRIPIIVITWIFAGGEDPVKTYARSGQYESLEVKGIINTLAASLFPKYRYEHEGRYWLRLKPSWIAFKEMLGIGMLRPWVFNGGNADIVLMEGSFMKSFYLAHGLHENQLAMIGAPSQDLIFSIRDDKVNKKSILYEKYKLNSALPLIVVGLIPDCFPLIDKAKLEFNDYQDFENFWFGNIAKLSSKFNILTVCHPGLDVDSRIRIEKKYGISLQNFSDSTVEILPLADLYITSVSSTIRWALSCSIPVIDYDFYDFGNPLASISGVTHISTKVEFVEFIDLLISDGIDSVFLQPIGAEASNTMGQIDGKACERISDLARELSRNRHLN